MTQSKHTPGPWFISYTHDDNLSMSIDDQLGIDGERNYDLAVVTHGCPDELLANAQLISAAPELLEALQLFAGVENFNGWHDKYREVIEKARTALAKATGVQEL